MRFRLIDRFNEAGRIMRGHTMEWAWSQMLEHFKAVHETESAMRWLGVKPRAR